MSIWLIPGKLGTISSDSKPGQEYVEFLGTLVYDAEGNLNMMALVNPPYLRAKTDAERIPAARADAQQRLIAEGQRRLGLVYPVFAQAHPSLFLLLRDIFLTVKANARDPLSGDLATINGIYVAWDDAMTYVNDQSRTLAELNSYDEKTTPGWPA